MEGNILVGSVACPTRNPEIPPCLSEEWLDLKRMLRQRDRSLSEGQAPTARHERLVSCHEIGIPRCWIHTSMYYEIKVANRAILIDFRRRREIACRPHHFIQHLTFMIDEKLVLTVINSVSLESDPHYPPLP